MPTPKPDFAEIVEQRAIKDYEASGGDWHYQSEEHRVSMREHYRKELIMEYCAKNPRAIEALVEDHEHAGVYRKRFMRHIDPATGKTAFVLERLDTQEAGDE